MKREWPVWAVKLLQRILALGEGRYQIIVTKTSAGIDWTVMRLGKVERHE